MCEIKLKWTNEDKFLFFFFFSFSPSVFHVKMYYGTCRILSIKRSRARQALPLSSTLRGSLPLWSPFLIIMQASAIFHLMLYSRHNPRRFLKVWYRKCFQPFQLTHATTVYRFVPECPSHIDWFRVFNGRYRSYRSTSKLLRAFGGWERRPEWPLVPAVLCQLS